MIESVTLNTCGGIGDNLWVVQKFSPYVKQINYNALCIDKSALQTRAESFLKLLPNTGTVSYKVVSSDKYNEVAWQYHPIKDILEAPERVHDYAVNKPLEIGYRLEDIDAGYKVDWNMKFKVNPEKIRLDKYILFYVSGTKNNFSWTPERWAQFYIALYRKNQLQRQGITTILFGAPYDAQPLTQILRYLKGQRMPTQICTNLNAEDSIRLIRDSAYFVGYQSGLNVIADMYDVPQIMMYFPFLKPMLKTWCKPDHIENHMFNPFTFDTHPDQILRETEESFKEYLYAH